MTLLWGRVKSNCLLENMTVSKACDKLMLMWSKLVFFPLLFLHMFGLTLSSLSASFWEPFLRAAEMIYTQRENTGLHCKGTFSKYRGNPRHCGAWGTLAKWRSWGDTNMYILTDQSEIYFWEKIQYSRIALYIPHSLCFTHLRQAQICYLRQATLPSLMSWPWKWHIPFCGKGMPKNTVFFLVYYQFTHVYCSSTVLL